MSVSNKTGGDTHGKSELKHSFGKKNQMLMRTTHSSFGVFVGAYEIATRLSFHAMDAIETVDGVRPKRKRTAIHLSKHASGKCAPERHTADQMLALLIVRMHTARRVRHAGVDGDRRAIRSGARFGQFDQSHARRSAATRLACIGCIACLACIDRIDCIDCVNIVDIPIRCRADEQTPRRCVPRGGRAWCVKVPREVRQRLEGGRGEHKETRGGADEEKGACKRRGRCENK